VDILAVFYLIARIGCKYGPGNDRKLYATPRDSQGQFFKEIAVDGLHVSLEDLMILRTI